MGTYFAIACDELKEQIEPGRINDLGIKAFAIAHPKHPLGQLAVYAMLHQWHGCAVRLVNDSGDDPAYYEYKDITEQLIAEYNHRYDTQYVYTNDDSADGDST